MDILDIAILKVHIEMKKFNCSTHMSNILNRYATMHNKGILVCTQYNAYAPQSSYNMLANTYQATAPVVLENDAHLKNRKLDRHLSKLRTEKMTWESVVGSWERLRGDLEEYDRKENSKLAGRLLTCIPNDKLFLSEKIKGINKLISLVTTIRQHPRDVNYALQESSNMYVLYMIDLFIGHLEDLAEELFSPYKVSVLFSKQTCLADFNKLEERIETRLESILKRFPWYIKFSIHTKYGYLVISGGNIRKSKDIHGFSQTNALINEMNMEAEKRIHALQKKYPDAFESLDLLNLVAHHSNDIKKEFVNQSEIIKKVTNWVGDIPLEVMGMWQELNEDTNKQHIYLEQEMTAIVDPKEILSELYSDIEVEIQHRKIGSIEDVTYIKTIKNNNLELQPFYR
ncbi:hypothetical protein [Bacillus bombysepticus]|uniref:hypothetical protein n=1 Tax=Bacillus bombysepticus TaxID=658666 RepID=UPI00301AA2BF